MSKLYTLISDLCKDRGITPGKMCTDIGISRGLITDLKMGRKHNVTGATLKKISDYLGVTVDFLLTGDKGLENIEDINFIIDIVKKKPAILELLKQVDGFSNKDIQKIISFSKTIEK